LHKNTLYIRECLCIKLYYTPQYKGRNRFFKYIHTKYILKHDKQASKILYARVKEDVDTEKKYIYTRDINAGG